MRAHMIGCWPCPVLTLPCNINEAPSTSLGVQTLYTGSITIYTLAHKHEARYFTAIITNSISSIHEHNVRCRRDGYYWVGNEYKKKRCSSITIVGCSENTNSEKVTCATSHGEHGGFDTALPLLRIDWSIVQSDFTWAKIKHLNSRTQSNAERSFNCVSAGHSHADKYVSQSMLTARVSIFTRLTLRRTGGVGPNEPDSCVMRLDHWYSLGMRRIRARDYPMCPSCCGCALHSLRIDSVTKTGLCRAPTPESTHSACRNRLC